MGQLLVNCLLYAELQEPVTILKNTLTVKRMKEHKKKSKIRETVEQMDKFVYLLSCMFTPDEKYDDDIERRVNAGNIVNGALHSFMCSQKISNEAQLVVHRGVLISTLT
ncbi:unnamed protein product [Pieris macdunnoughi]|uniref:Uncharacterized protein n=1 Tax=Pieris macdunnoughi TaxID=345717 RepID=A0A821QW27_9NEOP|nr:unnamed protein product [Pieris macdunnoughi]